MTTYTLWDRSTGRVIGSFADEDLALAVVRSINSDGPVNDTLALVRVDEQGLSLTLAVGPALAEQAEHAA
jgi:hypothetical protein